MLFQFQSIIFAFIGAVVWAVRLEGRVNTAIQRHEDLKEHLKDIIHESFADVDARLARIERALNGSLPHN